jgi:hypothetical protein
MIRHLRASAHRKELTMSLPPPRDQWQYLLQIMTTEHFTLQTERSATIADASGRAGLFLTSVSSAIIALALLWQVSHGGAVFFVVALALFPVLGFLGVVTFARVLQSAIEDMLCARGINRIRHFYTELAPQLSEYFILSTHDDGGGMSHNMRPSVLRWQSLLTTAGMVGVVNSVIAGTWATLAPTALPLAILLGLMVLLGCAVAHHSHQARAWRRLDQETPVRFPSAAPTMAARGPSGKAVGVRASHPRSSHAAGGGRRTSVNSSRPTLVRLVCLGHMRRRALNALNTTPRRAGKPICAPHSAM